jgi:hypothetical protein
MFSPQKNYHALFSRATLGQGHDHFDALDGIRSVALLWVLIFHAYVLILGTADKEITKHWSNHSLFFTLVENGHLGVDVFFVLSGFLIAYLLIKEYKNFDAKAQVILHDLMYRSPSTKPIGKFWRKIQNGVIFAKLFYFTDQTMRWLIH